LIRRTGPAHSRVEFAHHSEQEFARFLDYYRIRWTYEPLSFPVAWDSGRVAEMFTPDFYLPEHDQYVELTTMKQSLVTPKNRKLRLLRELDPHVNVRLLYRKDYHQLLGQAGYGALDMQHLPRSTWLRTFEGVDQRACRVARDHALICPDSFVPAALPGWLSL